MAASTEYDFEEILSKIGWGRYQWKFLFIFVISCFILSYAENAPILYTYTPKHRCHIPSNMSERFSSVLNQSQLVDLFIPFDEVLQGPSECLMYNVSGIIDSLPNKSALPQTKCVQGWDYELAGFFKSVVTDVRKTF